MDGNRLAPADQILEGCGINSRYKRVELGHHS